MPRTKADEWQAMHKRYEGFRLRRKSWHKDGKIADGDVLALDCMPSGWRAIIAIQPPTVQRHGGKCYNDFHRDEQWTLTEVLAFLPRAWHEEILEAHTSRMVYDQTKIQRAQARLDRLQRELEEVTDDAA